MKIASITPWLVKSSASYWGEFLFVEVKTDADVTGWGEVTSTTHPANRAVAGILRQLNDLLVGDDPCDIERIWNKTFRAFTYMGSRGATTQCVSAIDIALWDIHGKVLGQPIYQLLGGKVRDDIVLYTHPDQSKFTDREAIAREIGTIVDSGHTALKFDPFPHLDSGRPGNDGYIDGEMSRKGESMAAELTAYIRELVGPDIEILIDAHGRFNVPTAIRLCRRLQDAADIDWFEEPVPVESYHALHQVRQQIETPIAVGERLHTRWDFVQIFEKELADYIMPDVTWTGGISEMKKISTMAEAYYLPMSPHDAGGPINIMAGAHVMMTVPNFYRLESSNYDLRHYGNMIQSPLDSSGGRLKVSSAPGLGVEMNMDYLRANQADGFDNR